MEIHQHLDAEGGQDAPEGSATSISPATYRVVFPGNPVVLPSRAGLARDRGSGGIPKQMGIPNAIRIPPGETGICRMEGHRLNLPTRSGEAPDRGVPKADEPPEDVRKSRRANRMRGRTPGSHIPIQSSVKPIASSTESQGTSGTCRTIVNRRIDPGTDRMIVN